MYTLKYIDILGTIKCEINACILDFFLNIILKHFFMVLHLVIQQNLQQYSITKYANKISRTTKCEHKWSICMLIMLFYCNNLLYFFYRVKPNNYVCTYLTVATFKTFCAITFVSICCVNTGALIQARITNAFVIYTKY